jgi:hypothetical protein
VDHKQRHNQCAHQREPCCPCANVIWQGIELEKVAATTAVPVMIKWLPNPAAATSKPAAKVVTNSGQGGGGWGFANPTTTPMQRLPQGRATPSGSPVDGVTRKAYFAEHWRSISGKIAGTGRRTGGT